jgi:ComF family protein
MSPLRKLLLAARALVLQLGAARDCPACGEERRVEAAWCSDCAALLVPPETVESLDGLPLIAGARYAGPIAPAIHHLKYAGDVGLAEPLGRWLAPSLAPWCRQRGVALVPVPLHPERLAERGFNQSALVARALGRALGARVCPRVLTRVRSGSPQASLGRLVRQRILEGTFCVRHLPRPLPPGVVLVDDVVTTGSTARACARALGSAGLTVLAVVALARA